MFLNISTSRLENNPVWSCVVWRFCDDAALCVFESPKIKNKMKENIDICLTTMGKIHYARPHSLPKLFVFSGNKALLAVNFCAKCHVGAEQITINLFPLFHYNVALSTKESLPTT